MSNGIKFNIETNAIDAKHFFDSLSRSQLPFAISRAINRLAWDIRDDEQSKLDNYFDTRTNWLKKRGAMPVIPSKKKQYPDIHAIIGVKDEVAALSITGGTRRAGAGSEMAVPFSNSLGGGSARSILNPGKETLPKSKWPSKIVKPRKKSYPKRRSSTLKPKPFYMESKGRKFVALRSEVSRLPLVFLYEFKDSVKVDKQWPLIDNAGRYVRGNYDDFLSQEIEKAVKSIRL